MAKKYLKRVEEQVAKYGNVREAYEHEVGLLLERIAKVEQQYDVKVDVEALLPQRAMDMAGGMGHYREYKRWVEDVVRIRQADILEKAKPRNPKSFEEEPDNEIDNPTEENEVSQNDTYPHDNEDDYYSNDSWDKEEWDNDYDDYRYDESDEDEWDDIYEPDDNLPPSLADIQFERLGEQLDEYGDTPIVDDVRRAIDDAIDAQGRDNVGARINANFSKLQKNLDNAIIYEDDRHKYNYFMSEVLKCIRGFGFTKEENIEATEEAEKAGSVNPN